MSTLKLAWRTAIWPALIYTIGLFLGNLFLPALVALVLSLLNQPAWNEGSALLRLLWVWQVLAILDNFRIYWGFSNEFNVPDMDVKMKRRLNRGFTIALGGLTLWTLSFPVLVEVFKIDSILGGASVEIGIWILMVAYLCVNLWLIRHLLKRAAGRHGSDLKIYKQYALFYQRVVLLTDLPCIVPFTIVLGYALIRSGEFRAPDVLHGYLMGASAVLLFASNILSRGVRALFRVG